MSQVFLSYEHLKESGSYMNEFRKEKKLCDVSVKVGKRSFECHGIILISRSEYFRARLAHKPSDTREIVVSCMDFNEDHFELALTFIYGCRIEITADNVYPLLKLSDVLLIESLEDLCINFVSKSNIIPLDIVVRIVVYASNHVKTKLLNLTDNLAGFMAQNFTYISKDKAFEQVSPDTFIKIVAHPKLESIASIPLEFLSRYMIHCHNSGALSDLCERTILKQIPFQFVVGLCANIIPLCLSNVERQGNENLIAESAYECNDESEMKVKLSQVPEEGYYEEKKLPFVLFMRENERTHPQPSVNMYRFITREDLFYHRRFVGTHHSGECSHCKSVFVDNRRFTMIRTQRSNSLPSRSNNDAGTVKVPPNHTLMKLLNTETGEYELHPVSVPAMPAHVSGRKSSKSLGSYSTQIDPHSNRDFHFQFHICDDVNKLRLLREYIPKYPIIRENIALVAIGTNIYLHKDNEFLVYDCNLDEWTHMNTTGYRQVLSPNLLAYDGTEGGSMYLVGGKYSDPTVDSLCIQRYDFREGKWLEFHVQGLKPRCGSASCIRNDIMYISGGENLAYFEHGRNVVYFDIRANKWDVFQSKMPDSKMNHYLLPYEEKLWFFGGKKYEKTLTSGKDLVWDLSWYFYDLKESRWSDIFYLPDTYGAKYSTHEIMDVIKFENL